VYVDPVLPQAPGRDIAVLSLRIAEPVDFGELGQFAPIIVEAVSP
jgi:hypothetical protein